MKSLLIKDTTREERIRIIEESLSVCSGSCSECSACSMGSGNIDTIYQPYIDGEKELSEINRETAGGTVHC